MTHGGGEGTHSEPVSAGLGEGDEGLWFSRLSSQQASPGGPAAQTLDPDCRVSDPAGPGWSRIICISNKRPPGNRFETP